MTAQTLQISETQFKVYRRLFRELLFSNGHTIWPGYDIEIVLNNYIEKMKRKFLLKMINGSMKSVPISNPV